MTTSLDTVRYNCGIAGEEIADMVDSLEKENDQLREQVTMLRDALLTCSVGDFSTGHVIHPSFDEKLVEEALAATEPIDNESTTISNS